MRASIHHLLRIRRDQSGNVAIIFALATLPIMAAVGMAVDYSRANALRAKLLSAADAASVGSVGRKSPAFIAAGAMSSDGTVAGGKEDAEKIFNGNVNNAKGFTLNSVTATVGKANGTITSTVNFVATIPTMFLGVINRDSMVVTGTSTASVDVPAYINFYLLLDNSPSMGLAATTAGQKTLKDLTKNATNDPSCAFACHDGNQVSDRYLLAKTSNVPMRIDVLRDATQQLMATAKDARTYTSQYQMAIYDFGANSGAMGARSLFTLSDDLDAAKTAAGAIDLMVVYGQPDKNTGDANTPFSAVFPSIKDTIKQGGDGSKQSPQKFLFFVSDGVTDENDPGGGCPYSRTTYYNPTLRKSRCQSPLNTAFCDTIKGQNVKIAVLYTTYLAVTDNQWYVDWIAPFNAAGNSQIAQKMEACASPGFYFEVGPDQGIADAMKALFLKAISKPRISS